MRLGKVIYKKLEGKLKKDSVKEHLRRVNVVGDEEIDRLCDEFYEKLITNVIMVFGVAVLLCVMLAVRENTVSEQVVITRSSYGGSESTVELETDIDGEIENFDATVLPLNYDDDTIETAFAEGFEYIDSVYLGENETADEVCYDLNFVEYIDDLGLDVSWYVENSEAISYDGTIVEGTLEEPETVSIIVTLSYKSYAAEEQFFVVVYGKEKSKTTQIVEMLQEQIEALQLASGEESVLILPEEIEGYSISNKSSESNVFIFFLLGLVCCVLVGAKAFSDLKEKEEKRNKCLLAAYPNFVDMLSLYMGAGLTVKGSIRKISQVTEEPFLAKELCYVLNEIDSGMPEAEGYYQLGFRLKLPVYLKITTLLSQNIQKGTRDILRMLSEEEVAALQLKRELAKRKGEEAGTKLLFPMILQLVAVMVIVMMPAMMSF